MAWFGRLLPTSPRVYFSFSPKLAGKSYLKSPDSNIIERRYHMSEENAANTSSYVLVGSIFLYPLVRWGLFLLLHVDLSSRQCGYVVDRLRHRPIVIQLFFLSSILTMAAYCWFVLPPAWTKTPLPGISLFAMGHGFSPCQCLRSNTISLPLIVSVQYCWL